MLIQFTAGAGVARPQGQRVAIAAGGDPVAVLCAAISDLPAVPEGWFTGGVFRGDYRNGARWYGQQLILLDGDNYNEQGLRAPLTDEQRDMIVLAAEAGLLPGSFCYLTPRGLRIGLLLAELERDVEVAESAVRGAADLVNRALAEAGLGNIRVDTKALDLPHLMFSPRAIVGGVARDADVIEMQPEPYAAAALGAEALAPLRLVRVKAATAKMPGYTAAMLRYIDADDYANWYQVGMGLRESFGDDAFEVWDAWSARSPKYPGTEAAEQKWHSFQRGKGRLITFDTVRRLAREGGWVYGEVFAGLPRLKPQPARPPMMVSVRASDVKPVKVPWLWEGRFPLGRLSLISAPPGSGKSYLACHMSSVVSNGWIWTDGASCKPGTVILCTGEDDPADTIVPRLTACGADLEHVHIALGVRRIDSRTQKNSMQVFTLEDLAPLDEMLRRLPNTKLVVIDPIGSYFGGRRDSHVDTEVRDVLAPLALLAARHGPAVVMVAHTRKSFGGSADDSVLGSRAFTGLARAVHHVFRDPKNNHRRLLLPGKNNLGEERQGLAFRLVGAPLPDVIFEPDPVKTTADEMAAYMAKRGARGDRMNSPPGAVQEWLAVLLTRGPMPASEVRQVAKSAGLAWRSVQRASQDLGVLPRRDAFAGGWTWALPATPADALHDGTEPDDGAALLL